MALKPGRSDRQTLSALLLSGKLTLSEERVFRSMYDALEGGQVRLSPSQRMWADQIYEKLKLDEATPSKFKTIRPRGVATSGYDEMVKNLPLDPPGRKKKT